MLLLSSLYKTATTPAIAIAAAAKLPTCFTSAAALPVAEEPPAELVALAPEPFDPEEPEVAVADELLLRVLVPVAEAVAV